MSNAAVHLVAPDGTLVKRPATLLTPWQATTLRAYFYWAMSAQLEPELFCAECFDNSRESKANYQITEQDITILCACSLRSFTGPTPIMPIAITAMSLPSDDSGVAGVLLSSQSARLLRDYKKVLLATGMKEALRCNACFELNVPDGCEAFVTDSKIKIRCRCTDRTFTGSTT